jgi:hypothetical protein
METVVSKISMGLQRLWCGGYSLGKAFWLFFCLGFIGIIPIAMFAGIPFILLDQKPTGRLVFWAVFMGYEVIASVGVWRSANALLAAKDRIKPIIYGNAFKIVGAKIFVIITMIGNIMRLTGLKSLDQAVYLFFSH